MGTLRNTVTRGHCETRCSTNCHPVERDSIISRPIGVMGSTASSAERSPRTRRLTGSLLTVPVGGAGLSLGEVWWR